MHTELFWIEGPWRGRLAVAPRPRGGDWLEVEVRAWRRTGIGLVVSLLTSDECAELELTDEAECCRAQDIDFLSFPVVDRDVPSSPQSFDELAATLVGRLENGGHVVVHCRQGIGRAGLLACCLLVRSGIAPTTAAATVGAARGCPVPETPEQRAWLDRFATTRAAPPSRASSALGPSSARW